MQQQHHASQFKESWTDLEMRVDLENSTAAAAADVEENGAERVEGMGKKSVFRLYPPVGDGEVERLYWKRGVVGVGIGVVVVVVVAIVVAAGVYGRR